MIRYAQYKGGVQLAAQIAIRPLVEDEYILFSTQITAMFALKTYIDSDESNLPATSRDALAKYLTDMSHRLKENFEQMEDDESGSGNAVLGSIRSSVANFFFKSVEFASSSHSKQPIMTNSIFPDYLPFQTVTMEQF